MPDLELNTGPVPEIVAGVVAERLPGVMPGQFGPIIRVPPAFVGPCR